MHSITVGKYFREHTPNENINFFLNDNFEDSRKLKIDCYSGL